MFCGIIILSTSEYQCTIIKSKIINQVGEYLPFLEIEDVVFKSQSTGDAYVQSNKLNIEVRFFIIPLAVS